MLMIEKQGLVFFGFFLNSQGESELLWMRPHVLRKHLVTLTLPKTYVIISHVIKAHM